MNNNAEIKNAFKVVGREELLAAIGRESDSAERYEKSPDVTRWIVKEWLGKECRVVESYDAIPGEDKPRDYRSIRFSCYGRPAIAKFGRRGGLDWISFQLEGTVGRVDPRRVEIPAGYDDLATLVKLAARYVFGLDLAEGYEVGPRRPPRRAAR